MKAKVDIVEDSWQSTFLKLKNLSLSETVCYPSERLEWCSLNIHRGSTAVVTVGNLVMAKQERSLEFTNNPLGAPMSAQCSVCRRVFMAKPLPGLSSDNMVLQIKTEFDKHNCKEDASQAAARIEERSY